MKLRALLPPFVVGLCLATAGSISAGLLLYSGAGFLQAVAAIVATLLAALALGVWTGNAGTERDPVERMRRLWLFTLLAFTLAVVFSGAWELLDELPAERWVQSAGLAVLGALPLFAGGALVGAMTRADTVLGSGAGHRLPGPGSAALAGGAAGVVLSGIVLFPALSPTAMLLLGIVTLSATALFHGRMLDSRFLGRVVEERWTPDGELRVVDEVRGRPRALRRVLLQDGVLRGAEDEAGRPVREVDRAVAASLLERPGLERVLFLGGGVCTVPRLLAAERAGLEITVVEPSRAVVDVVRSHFPVSRGPGDGEAAEELASEGLPEVVHHVGWWEAEGAVGEGYQVVVADVAALFPFSPVYGLLGGGLDRLARLVSEDGELLLAGVSPAVGDGSVGNGSSGSLPDGADPLEPLLGEARARFDSVRVLRTRSPGRSNGARPSSLAGDRRDVLVLSRRARAPEPSSDEDPGPRR